MDLLQNKAALDVQTQVASKQATLPLEEASALRLEQGKSDMIQRRTAAAMGQFSPSTATGPGNAPSSPSMGLSPSSGLPLKGVTTNLATGAVQIKRGYEPTPEGRMEAVLNYSTAIRRLKELRTEMQTAKYGTGPASMRFQRGLFPNLYANVVGTPEEINFRDKASRYVNEYLTAQTGAQRGFKEIQFLEPTIPNPAYDAPATYLLKSKTSLKEMQSNLQSALEVMKAQGQRTDELEMQLADVLAEEAPDPASEAAEDDFEDI